MLLILLCIQALLWRGVRAHLPLGADGGPHPPTESVHLDGNMWFLPWLFTSQTSYWSRLYIHQHSSPQGHLSCDPPSHYNVHTGLPVLSRSDNIQRPRDPHLWPHGLSHTCLCSATTVFLLPHLRYIWSWQFHWLHTSCKSNKRPASKHTCPS